MSGAFQSDAFQNDAFQTDSGVVIVPHGAPPDAIAAVLAPTAIATNAVPQGSASVIEPPGH